MARITSDYVACLRYGATGDALVRSGVDQVSAQLVYLLSLGWVE